MEDGKLTGYIPESGMTSSHFKAAQELAHSQNVIAVVRNTNTALDPSQ